MKKKEILLVTVLLLPLLYLNVKNSHDWGDDFAAYIHQAKNMISGIPVAKTGFIINPDEPDRAPQAVPIGWSLLMVPSIAVFGDGILELEVYLSIFLVLLGVFSFMVYRNYFSFLTSVILVFIFCYNPSLVQFKAQILSDIPFASLMIAGILIYKSEKILELKKSLLLAFMLGFLMAVRTIGVVAIAACVINSLVNVLRVGDQNKEALRKNLFFTLISAALAFGIYFLLVRIIFPTPTEGFAFYINVMNKENYLKTIQLNMEYYIVVFQNFFRPNNGDWNFITYIVSSALLTFSFLGFVLQVKKSVGVIEWLTIIYLIGVLFFPYRMDDIRYLIPIFPFFILYAGIAMKSIKPFFITKTTIPSLLLLFILLLYVKDLKKIFRDRNEIVWGPQSASASALFEYIRTNTAPNATFVFKKPRVLCLYTGRRSFYPSINKDSSVNDQRYLGLGANYIIHYPVPDDVGLGNSVLDKYITDYKQKLNLVWNKDNLFLYEYSSHE